MRSINELRSGDSLSDLFVVEILVMRLT